MIHLAFAAHEIGYQPDRVHGGAAIGRVAFRDLTMTQQPDPYPVPPVQVLNPPLPVSIQPCTFRRRIGYWNPVSSNQ